MDHETQALQLHEDENEELIMNGNTNVAPTSSLTCVSVLKPPLKTLGSGSLQLKYSVQSPAWQCSFSRDGRYLAVAFGAPDPCVRIWKRREDHHYETSAAAGTATTGSKLAWHLCATLTGIHERTVRSLAFAPIHRPLILATASFDGSVAIWERIQEEEGEGSNNGGDSTDWECTAQLEGHENEVKCVTWNSTGSLLATCGRDKTIWIWECFLPGTIGGPEVKLQTYDQVAGDMECLAVLHGHEGDVKHAQFAPSHGQWGDGDEILLSASYDDTIKCWAEDAGDWYCAASYSAHTSTVWALTIAPGGGRFVSASADGSVAIFKGYTTAEKRQLLPNEPGSNGLWKCVGKLPTAHASAIYSIHCAPVKAGHGRIVSGGADNRIQIYREAMGSTSDRPLFSLEVSVEAQHGDVNCVCWHPWDGSLLASVGDNGLVRIWRYQQNT